MEDKGDACDSQRHKQKQLLHHMGRSLTLGNENAFTNKCKNVKESCQGQTSWPPLRSAVTNPRAPAHHCPSPDERSELSNPELKEKSSNRL